METQTEISRSSYQKSTFLTRYQIFSAKKAELREKARASRKGRKSELDLIAEYEADCEAVRATMSGPKMIKALDELYDRKEATLRTISKMREEREYVERMKNGRKLVLRSDILGEAAKRFVAGTPKAGRIRVGEDKDVIYKAHHSKLMSLFYPYVEGNRDMVTLMRFDLDAIFDGPQDLYHRLEDMVGTELACMPHLPVGKIINGKLVRPHLWVVIPDAVCFTEKGRKSNKTLFEGVYRGIAKALAPLGCDPAARALLVRGKNPLSDKFWSASWNNDTFPTLSEHAAYVDARISPEDALRHAAQVQSGLSKERSNKLFTDMQKAVFDFLQNSRAAGNQRYLDAVKSGTLFDLICDCIDPYDISDAEPRYVAYIFDKVVSYAATHWRHGNANAGRFESILESVPANARQAEAGRLVAKSRRESTVDMISDWICRNYAIFQTVPKSEIAKELSLSKRTVFYRWDEAVKAVQNAPMLKRDVPITINSEKGDDEMNDLNHKRTPPPVRMNSLARRPTVSVTPAQLRNDKPVAEASSVSFKDESESVMTSPVAEASSVSVDDDFMFGHDVPQMDIAVESSETVENEMRIAPSMSDKAEDEKATKKPIPAVFRIQDAPKKKIPVPSFLRVSEVDRKEYEAYMERKRSIMNKLHEAGLLEDRQFIKD